LVGQAHEVSNIGIVPESADLPWSGQGFEKRDEPAVRICNPSSDEVRISSCPSLEEGKEELGSENLEPGTGDLDSPAQGAVDYESVTPTRYTKNINGSVSHSSLTRNELYFPEWFRILCVGKSQKEKECLWSDSSADDEASDIEDLIFTSGYLIDRLLDIKPHVSLEIELAEILDTHMFGLHVIGLDGVVDESETEQSQISNSTWHWRKL
jgi:hypothetical protein